MLIRQAGINMVTSVASAALGLVSVSVLTRIFSPHEYGVYVLGFGFASVLSVFLAGWFRNLILSHHSRDDMADVRGTIIPGFAIVALAAPLSYGIASALDLDASAAMNAVILAVVIGVFELTQDLLRARLASLDVMAAALTRAVMFLGLGVAVAYVSPSGTLLLGAAIAAYLAAVLVRAGRAWGGSRIVFDRRELLSVARSGLPLTLSLTLLAVSGMTDRFVIASLVGPGDAARYVTGLDLVRQTLMMPALSAAAAFHPMAVQIQASQGDGVVQKHLADCAELLLAMILPGAIGIALLAPHVANIVLGPEFRLLAIHTMPIVAGAVVCQILTQQYIHLGFLLSGRNLYYLINAAVIIAVSVILTWLFVTALGVEGAAWARLGADAVGLGSAMLLSRWAFPTPLPVARLGRVLFAVLCMRLAIIVLDRLLKVSDVTACVLLTATGALVCGSLYWVLDVARSRERLRWGQYLFRTRLARLTLG